MKEQGLLSGMLKMSIYPSSGDMDLHVCKNVLSCIHKINTLYKHFTI